MKGTAKAIIFGDIEVNCFALDAVISKLFRDQNQTTIEVFWLKTELDNGGVILWGEFGKTVWETKGMEPRRRELEKARSVYVKCACCVRLVEWSPGGIEDLLYEFQIVHVGKKKESGLRLATWEKDTLKKTRHERRIVTGKTEVKEVALE